MEFQFFISSLVLAIILLSLLAWKWSISMKLAVPGSVVIGILVGLFVSLIDSRLITLSVITSIAFELFFIFLMVFLVILLRFYRDPERVATETEKVVLSPADGRVVYVSKVEKGSSLVSTKRGKKYRLDEITNTDSFTGAAYLVGIDMNVLNVHVNRSPIAGKAIFQKRTEGEFVSLRKPESEVLNERVVTVIDNGAFRVGVVQIASRLVRRIVSYIKVGHNLEIGQRIGAILFGSQVDVIIPELDNFKMEVSPGDELRAGVSVIARYG